MRGRIATKAAGGLLVAALVVAMAVEISETSLRFTGISVVGTNLVLRAVNPSGLSGVTLETRPDFNAEWQAATATPTSTASGELEFTIPKPDGIQFMRLRANPASATAAVALSPALDYVTISPLTLQTNPATGQIEAVIHFKGRVDGSDKIFIKRDGLFWDHVNWGWPEGAVTINRTDWRPAEQNYVTVAGPGPLLPPALTLDSATLEIIKARDVVALERTKDGLLVYVNDTVNGPDDYEFIIHFHPPKPRPVSKSTAATLTIKAVIDGSDCLHLTATGARWEHFQWQTPETVFLNAVEWKLTDASELKNGKENPLLPAGVDLSTAKVIERKGRDLVAVWADEKELRVYFADNPGGGDNYEVTIAFGQ